MYRFKRIFLIVTDGLGIGEEPRTAEFGDKGANSMLHASEVLPLDIPNWTKLGITEVAKVAGHVAKVKKPLAYVGKIYEMSNGKDTLTGHWEMMGVYTKVPNPQFIEHGFPKELVDKLSKEAFEGRKIIGNRHASGMQILEELGLQHIEKGNMIIYTSPDSTLQICGDEKTLGADKLNEYAKKLEQFALQILSEMLQELYLVHLFMKMENSLEHLIDMIMLTSLLLTLYLKIYKQKVLIP